MSRRRGGWNKYRGTVEKTPRIDSYEAAAIEGWGTLFAYRDGKIFPLDCCHDTGYWPEGEREIVELYPGEYSLDLSRKENGFGGSQAFFLCPACGERRRYLYYVGAAFLCRKCAQLNYRSQQETRSETMYFYRKGMDLAEKHLEAWPRPNGFDFCAWVPERPRYMHQTTYRRYLARFLRYRKRHEAREMLDVLRLLKMFK